MKKEVGLWIDRRRAAIVTVKNGDMEMQQVVSDIEKHVRFSGGAQDFSEEDIEERRLENHLRKYYDEIISKVDRSKLESIVSLISMLTADPLPRF